MSHEILLNKTITDLQIATDKMALLFILGDEQLRVNVDADCCSHSWIEHIELPAGGFPALVLAIEDLEIEVEQDHSEHDCLTKYGLKITTDKGDLVIDYRNESNGYYGGDLVWPTDHFYGGVYGQNVSTADFKPVTEVLS